MGRLRKWVLNNDSLTLLIGGILLYFSEDIVLFFYPLDPIPSGLISMLCYALLFSVAAFWAFKGLVYLTIKIYWPQMYEYFERAFNQDFVNLIPRWRVAVSLSFYSLLLLFLAIIFLAAASVI